MNVTRYTAYITTVDPTNNVVGFVTKGDAQERYATILTFPVAWRWPQEGEVWLVKQENGSWYLDGLLPNTVNNGIQGVVPGDAVINSPTGVVIIQGSEDGSTNFTFDANTYVPNGGTAGGDLTGTYPGPTVHKINGVTVPLTTSAWITPTLINSWVNSGGTFETAAYLKDPMGFVHLKGLIQGGASASVAFVLPTGYRPGATTFSTLALGSLAAGGAMEVDTSGNVTVWNGGSNVGLSGITFLAEN